MDLVAPTQPGSYLLVIDVVGTLYGSLASAGVPPGIVQVEIVPAPEVDPGWPLHDFQRYSAI